MKTLKLSVCIAMFSLGACSTGGGLGREEVVTHTYTSRTSIQRTVGGQPVEIISRPGLEATKIWTARLAFKNRTGYPLNIFLRPNLISNGWADGTESFVGSPGAATVTVAPGQVGTWTGQVKGRGTDILPFCFQSFGPVGDGVFECHPASVFLRSLPAPPLRLLLTVAGPRFSPHGRSAYPGSKFSLAKVAAPHNSSPRVVHLPGEPRQKVETIKRPGAPTSQGGFVP